MHILNARPAPRHILIPAAALDALLSAEWIGKGHLATVLKMSRYLWGDVSLEGSLTEFAQVLGIPLRTLQRHVPEVGQTGCWHYTRPHRGYIVILGFAQSREEVEEIRRALAPKMAQPVVVPPSERSPQKHPPERKQHEDWLEGEGGMGGGGRSAPKMAQTPKVAQTEAVTELAAILGDDVAARLAARFSLEQIARQLEH